MKTVKKTAPRSCSTIPRGVKKSIGIKGSIADTVSTNEDKPGRYLLVAADDLSPDERARLAPYAVSLGADEDILDHLSRLEKENRHLKSLNVTDELTGLYNKRFFNRQLTVEIARSQRTGDPFCLIFIDLDNFKTVNDTLGHIRGDQFLVKMCRQTKTKIRPTDFACRFGGDEFALILPATSLRDGLKVAERWHTHILQVAAEMHLPVSSSIGVDEFNPSARLAPGEFVDRVDKLLYKAKKTGKSKIVHPEIEFPESMAVSWAEKDVLYHIFQPSTKKGHSRRANRE